MIEAAGLAGMQQEGEKEGEKENMAQKAQEEEEEEEEKEGAKQQVQDCTEYSLPDSTMFTFKLYPQKDRAPLMRFMHSACFYQFSVGKEFRDEGHPYQVAHAMAKDP